jgi:hypothetical protein
MRRQCSPKGNLKYPTRRTFGRYAEILLCAIDTRAAGGLRLCEQARGQAGGPSRIWVHNRKLEKAVAPLRPHFHSGRYQRAVEAFGHLSITDAIT